MSDVNDSIQIVQYWLKASKINGCMTGSTLLDKDFSKWDEQPDIDVFAYSPASMVNAIDILEYRYGLKPGKNGKQQDGEAWKAKRLREHGVQSKAPVSSISYWDMVDGLPVTVNVSYKKNRSNMVDVLSTFDMTIVMRGVDLTSGYELDLRGDDPNTAQPNPLRKQDGDMYGTSMWVRQFNRVIKYWNRGFDTRPMARFYLDLIDEALSHGQLFQTEKSKAYFEEASAEFVEVRKKIKTWLDDKEGNEE